MPGSPVPTYLAGAKVSGFLAFGPTAGRQSTRPSSLRRLPQYRISIGPSALPDYDVLVGWLREGFDEIIAFGDATGSPALG